MAKIYLNFDCDFQIYMNFYSSSLSMFILQPRWEEWKREGKLMF